MTTSCDRLLVITSLCGLLTGSSRLPAHAAEPGEVRQHADQSFDRLWQQPESKGDRQSSANTPATGGEGIGGYSSEKYWIGKGQGDLAKGKIVCQRVSELSARTDLAKQIRVMVKEHMVDRVRDRSGREPEQDIELTREEIVQEYLQDVRILDHRIDEDNKTCHATAVMPRTSLQPKP
ncbi:hypothetical protein ACO9S2_06310 [Nitrospira sp. NS4]|uniref:hypothetical protein n=1 Tax=Nitrospira sp. NS4 TaxID=3414498 RepID=UPI003C309A1E